MLIYLHMMNHVHILHIQHLTTIPATMPTPSPVSAERSALSSTWSSVPRPPRRRQQPAPVPCCSRHCSSAPPPGPSGPHGPASPSRKTWKTTGSIHLFFLRDLWKYSGRQPDMKPPTRYHKRYPGGIQFQEGRSEHQHEKDVSLFWASQYLWYLLTPYSWIAKFTLEDKKKMFYKN